MKKMFDGFFEDFYYKLYLCFMFILCLGVIVLVVLLFTCLCWWFLPVVFILVLISYIVVHILDKKGVLDRLG